MPSFAKSAFCIAALLACSFASAAPVSLGEASAYNLVSFGDFRTASASIGGAVAVAGNMETSSMRINGSNQAVAGQALVVGGNLNASNGSVANGNAYVGGVRSISQSLSLGGQWNAGASPLAFGSLELQMQKLSDALASISATGSAVAQWGGLTVKGTNSAVEIFNFSAATLGSASYANFSNLLAGSTLILNIGGTAASLSNGMLGNLGNYNVLYNFYEAETLSLTSMGIVGSILAPDAIVRGGSSSIDGNVVVGGWDVSSIGVNNSRSFTMADVAGYTAPAMAGRPLADAAAPAQVPEPASAVLVVLALGLLSLVRRKMQMQMQMRMRMRMQKQPQRS